VAYFRRRAVVSGIVAGVVAFAGIFVLRGDATYLFDGLASRALPLVVLSAALGLGALLLVRRRAGRGARLAAVAAVVSVVGAWGVAQWDYLLPTTLTVTAAAAPSGTMTAVFVATGIAAVVVVPAFVLLYVLDQRTLLPEEGVTEPTTPRSRP
jgi:cytochrome bd ubiquinol oxidase subunit II